MSEWEVRQGLRVAVVGCGYWGPKHVRVLSASGAVQELSVVDPREDRLAALARSFPSIRTFSSLSDALPHVDAVVIATPPTTHRRLAGRRSGPASTSWSRSRSHPTPPTPRR